MSTSQEVLSRNVIVNYDSNIAISVSNDVGVDENLGYHGRYAIFKEIRQVPMLPETKSYKVGVVRAAVTTNNFPLFCPVPSGTGPITENGVQKWEVTAQPGLSLAWTGPVYSTDTSGGVAPLYSAAVASWPTQGVIPFRTQVTDPSWSGITGSVNPPTSGQFLCASYGTMPDVLIDYGGGVVLPTSYIGRLNTMIQASIPFITVAVSSGSASVGTSTFSQVLTFTNSDATRTVYFDFSVPSIGTELASTVNSYTDRAGVLQACKFLGFAPNSIVAIAPNSTFTCPRAFQLGFRVTLNVASYKTVRWVPEDRFTVAQGFVPSVDNILKGNTRTYFDCYSYEHFLTQCVNPTFQRCIYDENDASLTNLQDQCLTRQIQAICKANCTARPFDSTVPQNTGSSVSYNGRAYMWTGPTEVGDIPTQDFPTNNLGTLWQDCGPCILSTWSSNSTY
jgi:hypothetical protein